MQRLRAIGAFLLTCLVVAASIAQILQWLEVKPKEISVLLGVLTIGQWSGLVTALLFAIAALVMAGVSLYHSLTTIANLQNQTKDLKIKESGLQEQNNRLVQRIGGHQDEISEMNARHGIYTEQLQKVIRDEQKSVADLANRCAGLENKTLEQAKLLAAIPAPLGFEEFEQIQKAGWIKALADECHDLTAYLKTIVSETQVSGIPAEMNCLRYPLNREIWRQRIDDPWPWPLRPLWRFQKNYHDHKARVVKLSPPVKTGVITNPAELGGLAQLNLEQVTQMLEEHEKALLAWSEELLKAYPHPDEESI